MNLKLTAAPIVAAALAVQAIAAEPKAHQHGRASLQLTVDGGVLKLRLESPLENFTGFERAPRNDAERKAVQAMAKLLHDAGTQFVPSAKAGCRPAGTELRSDVLDPSLLAAAATQPPSQPKGNAAGGHADLEATFVFHCDRPGELRDLQVNLFDGFRRLHRIDAQIAGPKRQAAARLGSGSRKLSW